MEAGGKDRPPMLAPGNYIQWKSIIKRYIDTKPNYELIHYCLQNPPYEYKWNDKVVSVAEGGTETTTERFYKMMNELVRNQCDVTNHQVDVQFLLQLQPEWKRFVTLVKQSQELKTVSYHKLYDILKQHQNEVNEIRAERLTRINSGTRYDNKRIGNVVGAKENVGTPVVQQSGIQCYNFKEYGHVAREYAADNSGPIFDSEPLHKVPNNDNYNVFAIESEHLEQSKYVNDTYPIEQDEHNVIIDSLDMSYDREQVDQDDDDDDLATPESDEVIRLEKESRSKLSDLIRTFDYEKLNNLYDLFVPQREKSSAQRYFSE
nr:hypothetical protein [Tanacetum cinerariifolium]